MTIKTYSTQRKWSDAYIPEVINILEPLLNTKEEKVNIAITNNEVDMKEAADLEILSENEPPIRIALRLREKQYMDTYPYEFTIRYKYTGGYKTEFEKILEGHADLSFYGFVDNGAVVRWLFLNLDELRDEINEPYIKFEEKRNTDGRNSFRAYDIRSFKSHKFVLAHSLDFFKLKEIMMPTSCGTGVIGSKMFY